MFCVSSALRLIHFPTGHLLIHWPLTRLSDDQVKRLAAKRNRRKLLQLSKIRLRGDHGNKKVAELCRRSGPSLMVGVDADPLHTLRISTVC